MKLLLPSLLGLVLKKALIAFLLPPVGSTMLTTSPEGWKSNEDFLSFKVCVGCPFRRCIEQAEMGLRGSAGKSLLFLQKLPHHNPLIPNHLHKVQPLTQTANIHTHSLIINLLPYYNIAQNI